MKASSESMRSDQPKKEGGRMAALLICSAKNLPVRSCRARRFVFSIFLQSTRWDLHGQVQRFTVTQDRKMHGATLPCVQDLVQEMMLAQDLDGSTVIDPDGQEGVPHLPFY